MISSNRFSLSGLFVYYNVAVCPPESWSAHSFATFIFMLMAVQGSLLFLPMTAEGMVRYQPFSLKCNAETTKCLLMFLVLATLLVLFGMNLVFALRVLKCSSQAFNIAISATMLPINIMSFIEQVMSFHMVFLWLNDIINNGKALLEKELPSLAEIKDILNQYETLKYSVDRMIFITYLCLQLVTILAFYIGTEGKNKDYIFSTLFNYIYHVHISSQNRKSLLLWRICYSVWINLYCPLANSSH